MGNIEDDYIQQETIASLRKAIEGLSPQEKIFLSLYYYEDLNYNEIACTMYLPVSRIILIHRDVIKTLEQQLKSRK